MPPESPPPRESPWLQESLDRQYMLGLGFIVLLAIGFPLYRWREPGLRRAAEAEQRTTYTSLGRELFAQHCIACHGLDGTGTGVAPTLHTREFLGSATDQQIAWLITGGVPGSLMIGYGLDHGGPLTDQQVQQLLTYLRSWERDAPSAPEWRKGVRVEVLPPEPPSAPQAAVPVAERAGTGDPPGHDAGGMSRGDPAPPAAAGAPPPPAEGPDGAQLYVKYCQACHGALGVGGPPGLGPPLNVKAVLDTLTDARMAEVIAKGIPGKLMAGQGKAIGGPLAPAQVTALVAYLRRLSGSKPR